MAERPPSLTDPKSSSVKGGEDVSGLVERASRLSTSGLSDALDKLGIPGQIAGLRPISPHHFFCGEAFTVRYRPVSSTGENVGDYIDDVPTGWVVAIDNQGSPECTVWGDILTETASARGIAGTVVDGTSRDSAASVDAGYPIFSRSTWMRTGKDRVTVEGINVPIVLGGVNVEPGDLLVGDLDGVVAIPRASLAQVVEVAEAIEGVEEQIRAAVRAGQRLDHARATYGYHGLQRASGRGVTATGSQGS
ncbi:RraA family protein [Nocardioides sp.]|uniref:RraA family protein n=1 Tax=Nocardioides sp. TaxID=35761 RepID=UPI003D1034ED